MIIKITREYDKHRNLSKEYFAEKKEFEFEHRDTKKEYGSIEESMYRISDMEELTKVIKPNFFKNYTEYATFLILNEAKFNSKEQEE